MGFSFQRFYDEKVILRPEPGCFTSETGSERFSNRDLDPVRPSQRKWKWYHIGGFWIGSGFSAAVMSVPSSAVALGLNPGLALVACLIGNLMVAVPTAANSYICCKFGINFPVYCRASWGLWGAYIAVFIRAIVCVIWYAIQAWLAGLGVQAMIEAIWPSFATWHIDAFPPSLGCTPPELLSFTIFCLVSMPCLYLPITTLRHMFTFKVIVMPFFWTALFTWSVTAGGGFGPLFDMPSNLINGYSLGYVFCTMITAGIGPFATLCLNIGDFSRYAQSPREAWISQAVLLPIGVTLTELLGAVMASASGVIYGQVQWNPLMIVLMWDNRAAKFFAGLLFAIANLVTNVSANSISFANDVSFMFPRHLNIRRGQFICGVLGYAIVPFKIQATAATFLAFLGGYPIFLGPILAVLSVDYWIIRKGRGFNLYHLYKPYGIYWYNKGWNWRAIVAFVCGFVPVFPGLLASIGVQGVSWGAQAFYSMAWLDSVAIAAVVYYILASFFPYVTETEDEDKGLYLLQGQEWSPQYLAEKKDVYETTDEVSASIE